MKILLTGNKGFIGRHLERRLKKDGHIVQGFDLKDGMDIRNKHQIERTFKTFQPEVVIHLAALTGVRDSLKHPQSYFITNVVGTCNLLEVCKQWKTKKFLFASSSSVYGEQKCPLKEQDVYSFPFSPYGISKTTGEMLCRLFKDYFPVIVFRPFTVYGEEGRKDMVLGKLITAGLTGKTFFKYGDGNSTRGYTNVHDLVDGIVKLLDYEPEDNFEIFNLGGQEVIRLNDLIDIVKQEFPNLRVKQIARHPADVLHSFADITKAKQKVGFNPTRKFEEEIKKICEISKERGEF